MPYHSGEQARRARARAITNGRRARGVDLSAKALTGDQAWKVQAQLELGLGMRCHGCGRRVQIGVQFMSLDVTDSERPTVSRTACSRDDCDFAERARDGATVMKMVEYVWLDELGPDGPSFGLGDKPHASAEDGWPPSG